MATTFRAFKKTELFAAMVSSKNYGDETDIEDAFNEMIEAIADGANPEEVLHDEGFEPDYIFDLL